jgi:hypothetical protein
MVEEAEEPIKRLLTAAAVLPTFVRAVAGSRIAFSSPAAEGEKAQASTVTTRQEAAEMAAAGSEALEAQVARAAVLVEAVADGNTTVATVALQGVAVRMEPLASPGPWATAVAAATAVAVTAAVAAALEAATTAAAVAAAAAASIQV